jgi:hypothetical protein
MGEEQGTVPKRGVPDDDSSGKLSYPTPPNDPIDRAGPEGTREAGKVEGAGTATTRDGGKVQQQEE